MEEVHYGDEGPHWAVVPMKEKKKKILRIQYNSSSYSNNKIWFIKIEEHVTFMMTYEKTSALQEP